MLNPNKLRPSEPDDATPPSALITADEVSKQALFHFQHGVSNGSPTHYPSLNINWTWQRGEVTAVTGWPGHGKSLGMLNMMVTKAVYDDWKFALFVPENMPLHKITAILAQIYVGQSANPQHAFKMSLAQYEDAIKWINGHFVFIDPRLAYSLKTLLPAVREAKKFGIKGWLLDPWNDLESKLGDFAGMVSEQLRAMLKLVLDFTKEEGLVTVVCVHPAGDARNPKDFKLKVPDQYVMEGGRMWPNRMDAIIVWHRPLADDDPTDTAVDFYVKKMRNEPESGFKTGKGGVRINYQRSIFRYIDPILQISPLDPISIRRYRETGTTNILEPLPEAPF